MITSSRFIVDHSTTRLTIRRNDQERPVLVQNAETGKRPFVHPLAAPDGDGTATEDAPAHHPWQHGLYVGLNAVNGIGFWSEGLSGSASDGSFHPRPLATPSVGDEHVAWTVDCDWKAPDGHTLLRETQRWSFSSRADAFELDLDWSLHAAIDLHFGQHAYGGLFLRMPYRGDGSVVNSAGDSTVEACEGQRARWVAVAMPVPDRSAASPLSVAILDHPDNPGHPVPWRVDGQLGIAPSRCIAGAWTLPAGDSTNSCYRVITHCGASDPTTIEASWARFLDS